MARTPAPILVKISLPIVYIIHQQFCHLKKENCSLPTSHLPILNAFSPHKWIASLGVWWHLKSMHFRGAVKKHPVFVNTSLSPERCRQCPNAPPLVLVGTCRASWCWWWPLGNDDGITNALWWYSFPSKTIIAIYLLHFNAERLAINYLQKRPCEVALGQMPLLCQCCQQGVLWLVSEMSIKVKHCQRHRW